MQGQKDFVFEGDLFGDFRGFVELVGVLAVPLGWLRVFGVLLVLFGGLGVLLVLVGGFRGFVGLFWVLGVLLGCLEV